MAHRVTLIPGDGTGPVAEATRRVLEATGVEFDWDVQHAGTGRDGPERRQPTARARPRVDPAERNGAQGADHDARGRRLPLGQRRPAQVARPLRPGAALQELSGVRSRYANVDLIVIRENTEDLYAGVEFEEGTEDADELLDWLGQKGYPNIRRDSGISIKPISETGTRQIVQFAFDYARKNGRRKVTAVHKANIMKFTDGLFLHVAGTSPPRTRTSSSRSGSSTTSRCSSCSGRRSTTCSCCRTSTATSSRSAPA